MATRLTLDALLKFLTADIRSGFLAAIQDVVDNVILQQVIDAILEGNVTKAFEVLGFSPGALRPITAAIEKAYESGGIWTAAAYPKFLNTSNGKVVFRFNARNSRAEAWLRDKSSSLITRLVDETRTTIQATLQDGMIRGANPRNTALDIVGRIDPITGKRTGGVVGLTPHQEAWSRSFRQNLTDLNPAYFTKKLRDRRFDPLVERAVRDGKPLSVADIDKMVLSYRNRALKHRGDQIARTESLQALNAADYESTKQVVEMGAARPKDVKREWDSAGDTAVRFSHREMDGQVVGLDEPFRSPHGSLLMHPGDISLGATADEVIACRCRTKTVIDWLGIAAGD